MAGLPVIITDTGGMPEVIGNDYLNKFAFIVPEKDANAIYEVFKNLVSEKYIFSDNLVYVKNRMEIFSQKNWS